MASSAIIGFLVVASLTHLAAFIWLLVRAFKSSASWGWLLLVPYLLGLALGALGLPQVGALGSLAGLGLCIAFVVKNWQAAKQPFLVLLGSWLAAVAGCVALIVSIGTAALSGQLEASGAQPARSAVQPELPSSSDDPPQAPVLRAEPVPVPAVAELEDRVAQHPPRRLPVASPHPGRSKTTPHSASIPSLPAAASIVFDGQPEATSNPSRACPVAVRCTTSPYDVQQSLQFVSLSLSNSCAKPIQRVKFRLTYLGGKGERLQEWTTERTFDRSLSPGGTLDLAQPAFRMPFLTSSTRVQVKEVEFADQDRWSAP